MSIETIAAEDPEATPLVSAPFPNSRWGKLLYGLFIITMPVIAFWATELFKPEWQSGEFSAYLILLLFPEASLLFFVLLAYSIVCYCLLLLDADRYAQMYIVRFGVYTGVLLALQYSVLSGLFLFNDSFSWNSLYLIGLWLLPIFFPRIYLILVNRWGTKAVNTTLLTLAIAIFLANVWAMRSLLSPLVFALVVLTVAAPFWSLWMALQAAIWLFRTYGFKLTLLRGVGIAAWIAGYVAAWRFDILKMYELYAALPPQPPPDCYIATAAAQGHPQIVGSWSVQRGTGETMRVNKQLQILKCAELALIAVQPRLHIAFRKVYDVVGKPLAKRIRNPFLGDAAYLLLKPCDGLARFMLKIMIPEIDSIANKMYSNQES
ncbi:MAG TPA: DUF6688 family protein [Anaerolineales bacterium]|nr:DUF6688 family protein [Anaerolineales bacterium]